MSMKLANKKDSEAFTIIEVIVVIVVIGILASLSVFSYMSVRDNAARASLKTDLLNAREQIEADKIIDRSYPSSLELANGGDGLSKSSDTLLSYNSAYGEYCITSSSATNDLMAFHISSSDPDSVLDGPCQDTFKSISSTSYFTCAISINDKPYCWGYNADGNLGVGTQTNSSAMPLAVTKGEMPSASVKQITTGGWHSCVIASDDKPYCWGQNSDSQLGDSTTTIRTSPVAVKQGAMPSLNIKQISTGGYHTCVIASNDRPYCWGYNYDGQIGDSTNTTRSTPVAVSQGAMPSQTVKIIVAGDYHTCAIAMDDRAYCWGLNASGQLGDNSTMSRNAPVQVAQGTMTSLVVEQITLGYDHTCATTSQDLAYCWGSNDSGELGNGTWTNSSTPTAIIQGQMTSLNIKKISAGGYNNCVIGFDDKGYCWGSNAVGQIGDGTFDDQNSPNILAQGSMSSSSISQIDSGDESTCAIHESGRIFCWGADRYGQLGDSVTSLASAPSQKSVGAMPTSQTKQVTSGLRHTCSIAFDNRAYCWGLNTNGQLGNNSIVSSSVPVAVVQGDMPSLEVKQIQAGNYHTCAVAMLNDQVYCWGYNSSGQLGIASTTSQSVPKAVVIGTRPSLAVSSLSVGSYHTCVLASLNSYTYCWGRNSYGQIGDSTTVNKTSPVTVLQGAMTSQVMNEVYAGGYFTCGIAANSQAYCWGYNENGELGNNSTTSTSSPVAVLIGAMPSLLVRQISSNGYHSCAIATANNRAYCWGNNSEKELGDNTRTDRLTPVAVLQGSMPSLYFKNVYSGGYHSCAQAVDDTIYCWGNDNYGEVGDGSIIDKGTPTAISLGDMASRAIKKASLDFNFTCVIASDDQNYCWGSGTFGQLGSEIYTGLNDLAPDQLAYPVGN